MYRIKNFTFRADARYSLGLNYITNSNKRFMNEDLIFKYYYIDNAVIMDKIEFSGAIAYIFKYEVKSNK